MTPKPSILPAAMPRAWLGVALALAAALHAPAAVAQTVWRCGAAQFSQFGCDGGTAIEVTGTAPSAAATAAAREVAERERVLLASLVAERHAREATPMRPRAIAIGPDSLSRAQPAPPVQRRHRKTKARAVPAAGGTSQAVQCAVRSAADRAGCNRPGRPERTAAR
mgnify:CR=1 FL=1